MPTVVILATTDSALADLWERQLPPGRVALRLQSQGFPAGSTPGFAAVVVLDSACEASLPPAFVRCAVIYVGEPRSIPYEQARMTGRAKAFLSYEESATRLRDLLPLVEELAEKQSMVDLLTEKNRRSEVPRPILRTTHAASAELWDFLEGAVENIDSRERLFAEFRRASRHLLRASHAVFFHREADGFRADRGTSFIATDDPLVTFFENHPAVIDGTNWDGPTDPMSELAIRNRLALWGARLLVPVHENGRLLGLIAFGVRDDGQAYDDSDRGKAIFFARLLRHFLAKSSHINRLMMLSEQVNLGAKYLPQTLVLGSNENVPRHVPLAVRELIGQARRLREVCRISPSEGQPFRAGAGIVAETDGVWACWEEASGDVHDTATREYVGRRSLLRELALTLSHEVGNALVSMVAFRQMNADHPTPAHIIETVKADVQKLESLNNQFSLMESLYDSEACVLDVRDLAQTIGHALGLRVEVGPDPVELSVSKKLLDFALRSLIRTIAENRPDHGTRDLALKVRSTGGGSELTALLSVKGKHLQLEGILPEPVDGGVPNQGRLSVFLAKEILRLHHGQIHAGPGIEGTEILISVRKW
jgi:hypothetical protein